MWGVQSAPCVGVRDRGPSYSYTLLHFQLFFNLHATHKSLSLHAEYGPRISINVHRARDSKDPDRPPRERLPLSDWRKSSAEPQLDADDPLALCERCPGHRLGETSAKAMRGQAGACGRATGANASPLELLVRRRQHQRVERRVLELLRLQRREGKATRWRAPGRHTHRARRGLPLAASCPSWRGSNACPTAPRAPSRRARTNLRAAAPFAPCAPPSEVEARGGGDALETAPAPRNLRHSLTRSTDGETAEGAQQQRSEPCAERTTLKSAARPNPTLRRRGEAKRAPERGAERESRDGGRPLLHRGPVGSTATHRERPASGRRSYGAARWGGT